MYCNQNIEVGTYYIYTTIYMHIIMMCTSRYYSHISFMHFIVFAFDIKLPRSEAARLLASLGAALWGGAAVGTATFA